MSRRFEFRLKHDLPLKLVTSPGDPPIEARICDISPTYFRVESHQTLVTHKRYRFSILLPDFNEVHGEAKIERTVAPKNGENPSYVFLIDKISDRDENALLAWLDRVQAALADDRRRGNKEDPYQKNRRSGDRTAAVAKPRVMITGMGVVAPNAIGRAEFWKAIQEHKSGIREITIFDPSPFPVKFAGQLPDNTLEPLIPRRKSSHMGRATQLAWVAAKMAIKDAELNIEKENCDRVGVFMGTTLGTMAWVMEQYEKIGPTDYQGQHPYTIAAGSANAVSGEISVEFGLRGPSSTYSQGCSSSACAIINAVDQIQAGRVDVMVAGGAEAPLNPAIFGSFVRSGMMSTTPPTWKGNVITREDSNGSVLGEGACVLILESYDHAKRRGAPIFGELLSGGSASDGHHMVLPHPSGRGVSRAIREAMVSSGTKLDEIDLILGHFPGVKISYDVEMRALKREIGKHLQVIPITNIKPLIGYTQAVCSAFEIVAACLAFQQPVQWITYGRPSAPSKAHRALVNCIGFGGKNACLCLRGLNDD